MWFKLVCNMKLYMIQTDLLYETIHDSIWFVIWNYMWFKLVCNMKLYVIQTDLLYETIHDSIWFVIWNYTWFKLICYMKLGVCEMTSSELFMCIFCIVDTLFYSSCSLILGKSPDKLKRNINLRFQGEEGMVG